MPESLDTCLTQPHFVRSYHGWEFDGSVRSADYQLSRSEAEPARLMTTAFCLQSILRLGHFLSLGRLQSDYSDVDFLIRKPMTKGEVPTRSVEVIPSPRGLDR